MAMQLHGGGGLSRRLPARRRVDRRPRLRLADGPDEVHRGVVARLELGKYRMPPVTARRSWSPVPPPGLGAALAARVPRARRRGARHRLGARPSGQSTCVLDVTSDDDWAAALAVRRASTGAGSTSWSTTPASPAAAGSTSPASTSGSGSPRSTCSAWSAGPRTFVPMLKRQRLRARSSTSPPWRGWCTRPGWRSYNAVKAARGGLHRDARPRAGGVRRPGQRRSARRTSGPT